MTPEEVELRKEYDQIKDQPMFSEGGHLNHHLASVSLLVGLLDGLSGKSKLRQKREPKRNNVDYHWKRKKKGGNK